MARARVVVTGLRSIDKRLRTLPLRIQKKVVRQAMRGGMRIIFAAVKDQAPVLTGVLLANIKLRAGLKRKRDEVSIDVRIDANDRTKKISPTTGKVVFYPAIVEYKSEDPFMKRVFNATAEVARQETIRLLKEGVDREIKAS